MRQTPIKRTPFGEKRRANEQHEALQALTLEGIPKKRLGLFQLHHLDWSHLTTPRTDRGTLVSGFPDYMLGGIHIVTGHKWLAFLEIKHGKLPGVKGIGRLSASQHSYHEWLRDRGEEVWTAWLPEDLAAVNAWLSEKTGRTVSIDGLVA